VNQGNIVVILDMGAPTSVTELYNTLGHTRYYRRFIQIHAKVVVPFEKLLHKDTKYLWTYECQEALDTLKENVLTASILVFPDWLNIFHVHVDMSSIVLGAALA